MTTKHGFADQDFMQLTEQLRSSASSLTLVLDKWMEAYNRRAIAVLMKAHSATPEVVKLLIESPKKTQAGLRDANSELDLMLALIEQFQQQSDS